jgi:hypothetical protein
MSCRNLCMPSQPSKRAERFGSEAPEEAVVDVLRDDQEGDERARGSRDHLRRRHD